MTSAIPPSLRSAGWVRGAQQERRALSVLVTQGRARAVGEVAAAICWLASAAAGYLSGVTLEMSGGR